MSKKNILLVMDPLNVGSSLQQWIEENEQYDLTFAASDEVAIELSHQNLYDMVVMDLTAGVLNMKKLKAILPIFHSEILFLEYTGEDTEALTDRIKSLFERRKLERVRRLLVLDATKEASLANSLPPFSAN